MNHQNRSSYWAVQSYNKGPSIKRCRLFFQIFDTPLPHVGSFLVLSVGNFDQFLTLFTFMDGPKLQTIHCLFVCSRVGSLHYLKKRIRIQTIHINSFCEFVSNTYIHLKSNPRPRACIRIQIKIIAPKKCICTYKSK